MVPDFACAGGDVIGQCFRKVFADKSRGAGPGMEAIDRMS